MPPQPTDPVAAVQPQSAGRAPGTVPTRVFQCVRRFSGV